MNLWLFYPLARAIRFLEAAGIDVRCHVFRIGPFAFAIIWKKRGGGK